METDLTIIVDSNYVCYISKYAYSQGMSYKGDSTEVIFGFLRSILSLAERFSTRKFIFCWDSPKSKRKEIYPQYKSDRKLNKTDTDKEQDQLAYKQFTDLRVSILPKLGFQRNYLQDGYESDDLIASIVLNGDEKYIVVSSDEDLYQLLINCSMYNPSKKQLTTKRIFESEYKVDPSMWVDIKKIAGCKSDNIDGAWMIGEKTAIKYLKGELKETTQAYKSIKDAEKKGIFERNEKLIRLPLEGIVYHNFFPNELFYKKNFQYIFDKYGMTSFMKTDQFSRWVKSFHLI